MSKRNGKGKPKGSALRNTQTIVPVAAASSKSAASQPRPAYLGGLRAEGKRLRLTQDDPNAAYAKALSWFAPDYEADLHAGGFDPETITALDKETLKDLLITSNPEVSYGRWNFLRLENPGWEFQVFPLGAEDEGTEDAQGHAVIEGFFQTIKEREGSVNVPLNQILANVFRNGDVFAEVVFDRSGRNALRLATPDSRTVQFDRVTDPVLGQIMRPYQRTGPNQEDKVYLDDKPTVRFVPLDAAPGTRKGTAIMSATLFSSTFRMGLLHDLRRVIAQQGWPRIDIKVVSEALHLEMQRNPELAADPEAAKAWYDETFEQIRAEYGLLQPDDAYVHPDWVEVAGPVGTVDAQALGSIETVSNIIDQQDVRAQKTQPILLGMTPSTTETQANRQWEIAAAGHKAVQHLVEEVLESLLTVVLNAAGRQGRVVFRFSELRAAEMLRDAQVEALNISNARAKYEAGIFSQDQVAEALGVDKPDVPEPRGGVGAPLPEIPTDPINQDADPGNRRVPSLARPVQPRDSEHSQAEGNGHGAGRLPDNTNTYFVKCIACRQQVATRFGSDRRIGICETCFALETQTPEAREVARLVGQLIGEKQQQPEPHGGNGNGYGETGEGSETDALAAAAGGDE
jgi:hypothetical protein